MGNESSFSTCSVFDFSVNKLWSWLNSPQFGVMNSHIFKVQSWADEWRRDRWRFLIESLVRLVSGFETLTSETPEVEKYYCICLSRFLPLARSSGKHELLRMLPRTTKIDTRGGEEESSFLGNTHPPKAPGQLSPVQTWSKGFAFTRLCRVVHDRSPFPPLCP